MRLPLLLALGLVLVAALPVAAGGGERRVEASMYVSRTQASPGDEVTFWIWINPLKSKAKELVITESRIEGLAIGSTDAPNSCLERQLSWVCLQDDLQPFTIEVHATVDNGTDGRDLVNEARIEIWDRHHGDDDEGDRAEAISVRAQVHIVPVVEEQPEIEVQLSSTQPTIVPGNPTNYRVAVTNLGNSMANNVSVVVTVPASIVLLSASRWPSLQDGHLTWILDAVPVGSTVLLFNATLPLSNELEQVELVTAVTYKDGNGAEVRVESPPSSYSVLPLPATPGPSPLAIGVVLAVVAFVGRALFLPPGPIGSSLPRRSGADEIFLLHRSGILLKHFSPERSREQDSDIVGGMLAAVRMFVEDSMNPSAGPLQEIRFSGGSILFVTGGNAAIAAVNARGSRIRFAHRAMECLEEFESLNGDALTNFDGVAAQLQGVDNLVIQIAA